MNKRILIGIAGLLLVSVLVLSNGTRIVFADSITTPLNNSILNSGQVYNLTIDITGISSLTTSDTANLTVNGSLVYQHNYTANGLYTIPIQFNNFGLFVVGLKSTISHVKNYYNVQQPVYYEFYRYLLYYTFIIILWIVGLSLFFIIKKTLGDSIFNTFPLVLVSVFSLIYLLQNPTIAVNLYYLSLAMFIFVFFGAVAITLKQLFR